jgi:hypothetical protein
VIREEDTRNGVLSLVGGDAERARQLRANIAVFARRLGDPQITRMVNEVLAGRRNVREVFRTPQFTEVTDRNLGRIEEGLGRLTPEQREELFERMRDRDLPPEADERNRTLRDADLPRSPLNGRGEVEADVPRPQPRDPRPPSSGPHRPS